MSESKKNREMFESERMKAFFAPPEWKRCVSLSETAHALGLCERTVKRMVDRGELEGKRAGRRCLVIVESIDRWLAQKN